MCHQMDHIFSVCLRFSRYANIYLHLTMGIDSVMHHLQKWKLYPNIWIIIAKNLSPFKKKT